jgi:hypothetical protein
MRFRNNHSNGILQARAEPHPGWFLLWLPLLLIALDDSPDLSSSMIRLAAVLLLGMLAWGMGRGPAGPWAERGFAALLLVAWFAVCGTTFRLHGVPASMPARLAVTAGLLLGPVFLLWAWNRRARMVPVVDEAGVVAEPASAAALVKVLALVVIALFVLDRLFGVQRADLLVIGTGLVLYTTFRVQGRHRAFGVLG